MGEAKMKNKNILDLVFKNFLETGQIGYYLLYKKLKKEDKHESRNNHKGNSDKERSI